MSKLHKVNITLEAQLEAMIRRGAGLARQAIAEGRKPNLIHAVRLRQAIERGW